MTLALAVQPQPLVSPLPALRLSWQLPTIQAGALEVKLADSNEELQLAQALRYRVFVEEMGAKASAEMHEQRRDWDEFDAVCDHLLVVDKSREEKGKNPVVGTYRLLRGEVGKRYGKFYTASEFDITPALKLPYEILELGRSCVHPDYRGRSGMQLLWRGIGAYVEHYRIGLMFGCASFSGTDVAALKEALAYLHHQHLAPEDIRIRALKERYVTMNTLPKEAVEIKRIIMDLPPLIKGYLRLGAVIGDGAVLDHDYNTTDVCIMVRTATLTNSYYNRYACGSEKR
jgi:putative hemolysin